MLYVKINLNEDLFLGLVIATVWLEMYLSSSFHSERGLHVVVHQSV